MPWIIHAVLFILEPMTIKALKTTVNRFPEMEGVRPGRKEAEEAVRTLIRYIGENPEREGLRDTPARVVRAWDEFCSGYSMNPEGELSKTFEDITGYDDMVVVKNIDFISHCEHHMVPIIGVAHVAYWPGEKVVGISKLARVVDIFSARLVSQERMTIDIAEAIDRVLAPKGVAVIVEAGHQCMSTRGVKKGRSLTTTSKFTGVFLDNLEVRQRFLNLV